MTDFTCNVASLSRFEKPQITNFSKRYNFVQLLFVIHINVDVDYFVAAPNCIFIFAIQSSIYLLKQ